jgi:hypothetical protein
VKQRDFRYWPRLCENAKTLNRDVMQEERLTVDQCDELKRIPVILKHSLRERNSWRIRLGLVVG